MVVPPTLPLEMNDKPAVRRAARAIRRAFVASLENEERELLELDLGQRLLNLIPAESSVGSYLAVGDEIEPGLHSHWPSIAYPRVAGDALTFHVCRYGQMAPGYAKIMEPPADAPPVTPTVVLVPLVAADLRGNRIGQGGGHYDRTLAALRAAGPVTAIGLAWDMQIVAAIAADPWDQPLDWIATPQRLVDCRIAR